MTISDTEQALATALYDSMVDDHKRMNGNLLARYSTQTHELRKSLIAAWSEPRGLVEARGAENYNRLFGKQGPGRLYWACNGLPNDDHVSIWRRRTDHGIKISAWVSQPYDLREEDIVTMQEGADELGLQFDVSKWPSWHYPTPHISFIVWTIKGDILLPKIS